MIYNKWMPVVMLIGAVLSPLHSSAQNTDTKAPAPVATPVLDSRETNPSRGVYTVETAGKDTAGRTLFTLKSRQVDIAVLLQELFQKSGEQFVIDQDVSGPITLSLEKRTLSELEEAIQLSAHPVIRFDRTMAKTVRVLRVPVVTEIPTGAMVSQMGSSGPGSGYGSNANQRGFGVQSNQGGSGRGASSGASVSQGGFGGQNAQTYSNYGMANNSMQQGVQNVVTLKVSDRQPISLNDALQSMGKQSGVQINLDKQVPSGTMFSGTLNQTPVSVALDAIARTASLKVINQPDGAYYLVPTDEFKILIGSALIGKYPGQPFALCQRCQYPLLQIWNICPQCGLVTPHGRIITTPSVKQGAPKRLP